MKNERQVQIIAGFCDIRGFGNFLDRVSKPEAEFIPFWKSWKTVVDRFEKDSGYFVKRMGDGIFFAKELDETRASVEVIEVLRRIWIFTNRVHDLNESKKNPRPDGVRTVIVSDHAWKLPCIQFDYDYIGKRINMCEKVSHCYGLGLVTVHETVVDHLTPLQVENNRFDFSKIEPKCERVNEQDIKALFNFRMRSSGQ